MSNCTISENAPVIECKNPNGQKQKPEKPVFETPFEQMQFEKDKFGVLVYFQPEANPGESQKPSDKMEAKRVFIHPKGVIPAGITPSTYISHRPMTRAERRELLMNIYRKIKKKHQAIKNRKKNGI